MKARIEVVILMFCCFVHCFGQGTLQITFDGPPLQPPGTGAYIQQYSELGMSFTPLTSFGFARVGGGGGRPDNGTAYLQATLGDSLLFSFINGSVFGLVSIDLAEYSTVVPNAVQVLLVGYRQDGSTVSVNFTTDGIIDGGGPLADFQTFYFDKEWIDLTRVEIPTFGWSLDNLRVGVRVPEPTTSTMLLGGAGLWFFARRKNRTRWF